MKASVVIPTYNGARFIREALESVFAQASLPGEIIVVDDHSSDDTVEVVRQLSKVSPVPLRLIRLKTNSGGPARPMNIGVEAAAGEIICLLDHDDLMDPAKVALHTLALQQDSIGLAFGQSASLINGVLSPPRAERFAETAALAERTAKDNVRVLEAAAAFELLVRSGYNYGGAGGTSFRKEAWRTVGGLDESYKIVWDYDFALRLTQAGFDIAYCEQAVYVHRMHEGNLEFSNGGIELARETVRLFARHSKSAGLSKPAKSLLAKCHASAQLGLVWQLRRRRRFGEAFQELRSGIRERGCSLNCAKEFLKTAAASVTPAFLLAKRPSDS